MTFDLNVTHHNSLIPTLISMNKETAVVIKAQFLSEFSLISECGVIQLHHFALGQEFISLPEFKKKWRELNCSLRLLAFSRPLDFM